MPSIIHILLLASIIFLFISSAAADFAGLQEVRTILFSVVVGLAGLLSLVCRPRFHTANPSWPLAMIALLVLIAVADLAGTAELLDYKIVLPIFAVLMAPSLAHNVDRGRLLRHFRYLLAVYVGTTAGSLMVGGPNVSVHRFDAILRTDVTGSLISHSSLCTIYVVLAATAVMSREARYRSVEAAMLCLAFWMLMLTATRTAVVTMALFGLLALHAGHYSFTRIRILAAAATVAALVFTIYSTAIDRSFYHRFLASEVSDFSSGRFDSIAYWLRLTDGSPFGIGMGAIRQSLAGGRPQLDGNSMLEWPHNEFVRFYVEAGQLGLLLVLLLVGGVTHTVLRSTRMTDDLLARHAMLVIVADMLARTCFQNYFNTVYHSTVLIMIAMVLAQRPTTHAVRIGAGRPGGDQGARITGEARTRALTVWTHPQSTTGGWRRSPPTTSH